MSRSNTASVTAPVQHVVVANAPDVTHHTPANEAALTKEPLPVYVLTDAQRTHYTAAAMALAPAAINKALLSNVNARLNWMGTIQGTAWYDQAELADVVFDGSPITRADIDDFGYRIVFARSVVVADKMSDTRSSTAVTALSDGALSRELRRCNKVICAALLRRCVAEERQGKDGSALRKDLRALRIERNGDLGEASVGVLNLCESATTVAFLNRLPKREGAALERLRVLSPEWERRCKHVGTAPETDGTATDLPQRAYALAAQSLARIVNAGRYLIEGRAERRGDYPGYHPPKRRAARTPKVVSPPVPAVPAIAPHNG